MGVQEIFFIVGRKKKFGVAIYGAAHYNFAYNPDDDNFTNIPLTRSFSLNPKIFYYPNEHSIIWFGVNATTDNREGGDINVVQDGIDSEHQYFENNNSNRISTQLAYESKLANNQSIELKNSIGYFSRKINFPDYLFNGDVNSFTELNYAKNGKNTDWILGANIYTNSFQENIDISPRNMKQKTIGIFVNNTSNINRRFILESGFRADYSRDWGLFPLPRISLLWKVNNTFSTRIGGGLGYKLPDMFSEEAATVNFRNVQPISAANLNAEKSFGVNLDFNYRTAITEKLFISINQLFYNTEISEALLLERNSTTSFAFTNAEEIIQSLGSETNIKLSYKDFRWFINYAYINARLNYLPGNPQKFLTPKHNAGTVLMYENEDWRIGYEIYYTGKQNLSSGVQSTDFSTMGILVQKHFKWGSPYINFENFTDVRQSRYSPEVEGTIQNPIFSEIYAPTDGFVFTIGINIKPFGREECDDGCHAN